MIYIWYICRQKMTIEMKKLLLSLCLLCAGQVLHAQSEAPFKTSLYNEEFDLEVKINFYDADVTVPHMEMFGEQPGYLIKKRTSYPWIIAEAELTDERTAQLVMINDAGSEDLIATLTCESDSVYVLKQGKGSTIKIPKGSKWMKLPTTIMLKTKKYD